MDRRVAATLAAVALFALAGCSALPVFDSGSTTPTPTPTATPTSPAATPSATTAGTPTPTLAPIDFPEGYGPTGVEDPDAAIANHNRTLTGYDSYRFRFDVGIGAGDGTRDAFVYLLRADHDAERALEIRDDGDVTLSQYYENDRVYVEQKVGDNRTYNSTDQPYRSERLTGIQFVATLFDHVDYGGPDIRDTDNGTLFRYQSEEVTDPEAILPSDTTEDEIDSFDVELIVHEDGYVRFARYTVVTQDGTELAALARVEAVNETAVDRPEWFDEAADR